MPPVSSFEPPEADWFEELCENEEWRLRDAFLAELRMDVVPLFTYSWGMINVLRIQGISWRDILGYLGDPAAC